MPYTFVSNAFFRSSMHPSSFKMSFPIVLIIRVSLVPPLSFESLWDTEHYWVSSWSVCAASNAFDVLLFRRADPPLCQSISHRQSKHCLLLWAFAIVSFSLDKAKYRGLEADVGENVFKHYFVESVSRIIACEADLVVLQTWSITRMDGLFRPSHTYLLCYLWLNLLSFY